MKSREARKITCPACGAALTYDPGTGKLRCGRCGSTFLPGEPPAGQGKQGEAQDEPAEQGAAPGKQGAAQDEPAEQGAAPGKQGAAQDEPAEQGAESAELSAEPAGFCAEPDSSGAAAVDLNDGELMCRIYTCSSCGAELNINDTECSTFCPYCGQPTLVFDSLGTMEKPDLIIPFSVTRERAAQLLREKLRKGRYVPPALREVPIDRIAGIYIPYWIYDIDYAEKAVISGYPDEDSHDPKYFYLDAERHFSALPGEGAVRLDDALSDILEPYHIAGAKSFDPSYLSGFYSDRYDDDPSRLEKAAAERARGFLEKEMVKKVHDEEDMSHVSISRKTESHIVTDRRYAFFPAWFLTFRWQDRPVTILVNGQTEKVVGGLPVHKKAYIISTILSCLWAVPVGILFAWLTMWIFSDSAAEQAEGYAVLALVAMGLIVFGAACVYSVKKAGRLSQADDTRSFAFDRQKGGRS